MDLMKIIGVLFTLIFTAISLFGAPSGSTYKFSFLFLSALLWGMYALRRKIVLHPLHFGLLALALLLHNLGAFGCYEKNYFSMEFDFYVHFYFGFVGGLIFFRAFHHHFHLNGWKLGFAVVIFVLGIGGIHELIEYASSLAMGPEKGMLKYMRNDPFDTQKDLLNNFLGALLAVIGYFFVRKKSNCSRQTILPD